MNNIKDIVIGIFAVIGFAAIVTGFTNEAAEDVDPQYPESHVWEAIALDGANDDAQRLYMYNKKTGEVRKYNRIFPQYRLENWREVGTEFIVMKNLNDLDVRKK